MDLSFLKYDKKFVKLKFRNLLVIEHEINSPFVSRLLECECGII
jgi:hypothetical protein